MGKTRQPDRLREATNLMPAACETAAGLKVLHSRLLVLITCTTRLFCCLRSACLPLLQVEGDLLLGDMGQGLPLRTGTFDGAISISALQWLCNADKAGHEPRARLRAFFTSLYRALTRGSRAVLQVRHPAAFGACDGCVCLVAGMTPKQQSQGAQTWLRRSAAGGLLQLPWVSVMVDRFSLKVSQSHSIGAWLAQFPAGVGLWRGCRWQLK
jgi:hypothetical protein